MMHRRNFGKAAAAATLAYLFPTTASSTEVEFKPGPLLGRSVDHVIYDDYVNFYTGQAITVRGNDLPSGLKKDTTYYVATQPRDPSQFAIRLENGLSLDIRAL